MYIYICTQSYTYTQDTIKGCTSTYALTLDARQHTHFGCEQVVCTYTHIYTFTYTPRHPHVQTHLLIYKFTCACA